MRKEKIHINVVRYLLPVLFFGYFISVTFFPHTHIYDGVKIVHSHPFKPNSDSQPSGHNHTHQGYLFINHISKILVAGIFLLTLSFTFRQTYFLFIRERRKYFVINSLKHTLYFPRAPGM